MDITTFKQEMEKLLKSLDEKQTELASIRAMMLVNFGKGAREYSNIIDDSMTTWGMILNVLEYFDKKLKKYATSTIQH